MVKMDEKYFGNIFKASDDTVVPDDQWVILRIKDDLFLPTLTFYIGQCIVEGCDDGLIQALIRLRKRALKWREEHPDLCRLPD